ncbi:hypothetical protein EW146_g1546 [Bondarzewia mesenterica]|uniref:Uncharacterized protein n=1 Tax=Bondarzewia mesenterica TaxID=1095465 RepID=A0A4S4M512_9AGAM|nr:hypothetical protein EW146_g1546 [Bondarzewia mesenterica]
MQATDMQSAAYWLPVLVGAAALDRNIDDTDTQSNLELPDEIELSNRPPRLPGSAPPMTIPQFKAWTTQTSTSLLRVNKVTLWKSRKEPWRHEFVVVTLTPRRNFRPRALTRPSSALASFNVTESVERGLTFRIDRGRRSRRGRKPGQAGSGSHQAAVDMVELMNCDATLQLDRDHDACFTFRYQEKLSDGGLCLPFICPRLSDVIFCLERASQALGPEYRLLSLNCWSFASYIFQLVKFLFIHICVTEGNMDGPRLSFFRKRFYGTQYQESPHDLDFNDPLFNPLAIFGYESDANLPLDKNPFRVLLFITSCRCQGSNSVVSLMDITSNVIQLCAFSFLSTELEPTGILSMLEMAVMSSIGFGSKDLKASDTTFTLMNGFIITVCGMAIVQANKGKEHGINPRRLELCIRLVMSICCHDTIKQPQLDKARAEIIVAMGCLIDFRKDHCQAGVELGFLDFIVTVLQSGPPEDTWKSAIKTLHTIANADPSLLTTRPEVFDFVTEFFSRLFRNPRADDVLSGPEVFDIYSEAFTERLVDGGILKDILAFIKRWKLPARRPGRERKEDHPATFPSFNTKNLMGSFQRAGIQVPKTKVKLEHSTCKYLAVKILASKARSFRDSASPAEPNDASRVILRPIPADVLQAIEIYLGGLSPRSLKNQMKEVIRLLKDINFGGSRLKGVDMVKHVLEKSDFARKLFKDVDFRVHEKNSVLAFDYATSHMSVVLTAVSLPLIDRKTENEAGDKAGRGIGRKAQPS